MLSLRLQSFIKAASTGSKVALNSELLTWYLGNLSAFWACWAGCDHVMDLELGSRKPRVGLIQGLAKSLENSRSMRRTEWGQRDTELIFGGFEISGIL